jgi:hypothetical protein
MKAGGNGSAIARMAASGPGFSSVTSPDGGATSQTSSSSSTSDKDIRKSELLVRARSHPCLATADVGESPVRASSALQRDVQHARSRSVSWGDANGRGLEDSVSFWRDDAPCQCRHGGSKSPTPRSPRSPRSPFSPFKDTVLPLSHVEFMCQLSEQGVQLERTVIRWPMIFMTIRVLNLSFEKRVFVRLTSNKWRTYLDVDAAYREQSSDGCTDEFQVGIKVPHSLMSDEMELAICFVANGREYWDNNRGSNYHLRICHRHKSVPDAPSPAGRDAAGVSSDCDVCPMLPVKPASAPVSPLKSILSRKCLGQQTAAAIATATATAAATVAAAAATAAARTTESVASEA